MSISSIVYNANDLRNITSAQTCISGKVVDAKDGSPLPRISIRIKGTDKVPTPMLMELLAQIQ